MPRTIAIGDIHGCGAALDRVLGEIKVQQEDTVIALGDYVDRGINSSDVIEMLTDLVGRCRFVPLIGNHELMMFKALQNEKDFDFWMQHGGNATLASYGGRVQNIPQHHLTFLSHCVRFYETENHIFLHANYHPDLPLAEQPDDLIFWQHIGHLPPPPHYSGKTAIVGHTPQVEGHVRNLGHVQILDTFCYGDGWLTAMEVNTGEIWQANNFGDFRTDNLDEPEDLTDPFARESSDDDYY